MKKTRFDLRETLKSLANNKHNDSTTTYYLLHKKWLKSLSNLEVSSRESSVVLTDENYDDIADLIEIDMNSQTLTMQ